MVCHEMKSNPKKKKKKRIKYNFSELEDQIEVMMTL
jgi:hypothetical protein